MQKFNIEDPYHHSLADARNISKCNFTLNHKYEPKQNINQMVSEKANDTENFE